MSEHPDPERWWRHRRWMAWTGLAFAGAAYALTTLAIALGADGAPDMRPLAQSAMWVGCAPMIAYMSNCAIESFAKGGMR
ncbi:hypothetical protein [Algiphilus aromaticivorans]|uniref:hypothetical protein n=1 Tax=Algiphilus aromaticivorans TaxID=382454 RepID=UPI0005C19524|nr:hypothetical protein [Algiphilus aromaticivorans]